MGRPARPARGAPPGGRGAAGLSPSADAAAPPWNRRLALLVATVMFMEHLDGTILVTATPAIAADLGVSSAEAGIAWITWPALLAPLLAPLIGGLLTTWAGWPWIFLVNVPVGLLALVVALRTVPDSGAAPGRPDRWGLLWCSVTLFGLVTGMELVSGTDRAGSGVLLLCAAGVGAALAVRWMLRADEPLLDLRLYRITTYRTADSGGFVYRLMISAVPFLLPLLFQDGFGGSPVQAGLLVTAVFLGNIGVKPMTTPLLRRFGFRTVLIAAVAGGAACLAAFTLLSEGTPLPVVVTLLLLSGALRSVGFTAYNSLQFADVEAGRIPSVNTLSATGAHLATGLGVAVGALVLQSSTALGQDTAGELFPYRAVFTVLALLLLVPLVGAVSLPGTAAAHVTGRPGPLPPAERTGPRSTSDDGAAPGTPRTPGM